MKINRNKCRSIGFLKSNKHQQNLVFIKKVSGIMVAKNFKGAVIFLIFLEFRTLIYKNTKKKSLAPLY
jgi:tellurite resistance protein TehA-like permease